MNLETESLPRVPLEDRNRLPRCSAVYFAITKNGTVFYVGQAVDIKRRWCKQYRRFDRFAPGFIYIAWLEVPSDYLRLVEKVLIERLRPPMNWVGGVTQHLRDQGLPDPLITQRRVAAYRKA